MSLEELIDQQRKKLMRCAEAVEPTITEEDLLQPMDYPELERDPLFRYEEGILEGLLTALFFLRGDADDAAHAK